MSGRGAARSPRFHLSPHKGARRNMTRLPLLARRLAPRILLAALSTLVALTAGAFAPGGRALAQTAMVPAAQGFALDRYNPASPGSDWFVLDSLDLRGSGRPALRVGLDWGEKPLVLYDANDDEMFAVIQRQVFVHVGFAINIASRVRLGVNMPFAVNQLG